jgi:hypothetical protein
MHLLAEHDHPLPHMCIKTLGMTDADDLYATMVREGAITPEAALLKMHIILDMTIGGLNGIHTRTWR